MSLPFGKTEFLAVFVRYNEAVWPAQMVLYALAIAALLGLFMRLRQADRAMAALLALLWAWAGLVYHGLYFREINPAAPLFVVLFIAGAAALAWEGVVRDRLRFCGAPRGRAAAGQALIAYALVFYPLLSIVFGHVYPAAPTFGMPCPVTIFTVGVLLQLKAPYPRSVLIAPLLWIVVAGQAAFRFGVWEDLGLLVAGVAAFSAAFTQSMEAKHA
jgi:hypothetical protein